MDVAHLMAAAVLFDIDGVLVLSWRAIPGAAETVRQLTHRGIACAYLTNTTTPPAGRSPRRWVPRGSPSPPTT